MPATVSQTVQVGPDLLTQVRAGFVRKGTSFHAWCLDQAITRQNARKALMGEWNGPAAQKLRRRILKAAGITLQVAA